ncbi:MAG: MBL fold metallo-hydrolase, partial [bacterium]
LQLISEDAQLSGAVSVRHAPGHTPGHIALLISDGGQEAMIVGDAIVHPAQVSEPEWRFLFDMDPDAAIATRKRLLGRMELESITAIQCHCPPPGFGLIVRTEARRHWQPLEQAGDF